MLIAMTVSLMKFDERDGCARWRRLSTMNTMEMIKHDEIVLHDVGHDFIVPLWRGR